MKHLISVKGNIEEGSNISNFNEVLKIIKDQLADDGWQFFENNLRKNSLVSFKKEKKKVWLLLKKISWANRNDEGEFRIQIPDSVLAEVKIDNSKKLLSLSPQDNEFFMPLGFYHDEGKVLIFMTFSPSLISKTAKNRSYYVSLESLAKSIVQGYAYFYDAVSEEKLCFSEKNLSFVINNFKKIETYEKFI